MQENTQEKDHSSILGQPVISLCEGTVLGRIRQAVIDGEKKRISAFTVERRRGGREENILPFAAVSSFGTDGIIINQRRQLLRRTDAAEQQRLLRHQLPLIGARVFTASGRSLGRVEEYRFDTGTGSISALEIRGGLFRSRTLTPGRCIIAISEQTVMMQDEAIDEAVPCDGMRLSAATGIPDAVRERLAALRSDPAQATRELAANLSELIGLDRLHRSSDIDRLSEPTDGPDDVPGSYAAYSDYSDYEAAYEDIPEASESALSRKLYDNGN